MTRALGALLLALAGLRRGGGARHVHGRGGEALPAALAAAAAAGGRDERARRRSRGGRARPGPVLRARACRGGGDISCATCHQPERSFDRRTRAVARRRQTGGATRRRCGTSPTTAGSSGTAARTRCGRRRCTRSRTRWRWRAAATRWWRAVRGDARLRSRVRGRLRPAAGPGRAPGRRQPRVRQPGQGDRGVRAHAAQPARAVRRVRGGRPRAGRREAGGSLAPRRSAA